MSFEEMEARIKQRLQQNPEDIEGWFLLGRTYMARQRFDEAVTAYQRSNDLLPNEPGIMFALADALGNGEIRAAAIDVLPKEPPVDGDPLLDYQGDNLIVTPHTAWASDEARQSAIDELEANTRAFIAGEERNRLA